MKDLIILGAGPAGLSAAIYGIRAGLNLIILEKFSPGGQVMNTYEVENYPGFANPIPGWELVSAMENQARRLGAEIISGEIATLSFDSRTKIFTATLADGSTVQAKSIIAATGASLKKLGIPGEEHFFGRGVSYCATCDGAFYKDRVTAVIGGGNTALEEAHFLTRFARRVYLIHRRNQYRADKILKERIASDEKIVPVLETIPLSINGDTKVKSLTVKNIRTEQITELAVDGVFVFIGYIPNTSYLPKDVLNEKGEVIVDIHMRTKIPGLFAAGDLRSESRRQIVMACADGATAAMSAYEYLSQQ
ncbi:MAG: thioredoxin-disulfide reductase [Spirochaetes bacterium]|nr:thioredoxin-disulfide reductase [Spirochaetota bacterium]